MTKRKSAANNVMEININITDWNEEYLDSEPNVSSEGEIINRAKEGAKPSQLGRHMIVARERGDAPSNITSPNKTLLMLGGATRISQLIANKYDEFVTKNGKKIKVRGLVCATDDSEIDAVVDYESEQGLKNALSYLQNQIPSYIFGRLAIVAQHSTNGEVEKQADVLIDRIREMVKELT